MAKKYLCGFLAWVILVCAMCIFIGFAPRPVREPAEVFLTIEEEYIQAVEDYRKLGKVNVPEGATFSISEDLISINDSYSNATLSCRTVLNDSVPVYDYSYSKHLPSLVILLFVFYCLASWVIVKAIYEIIKILLKRFPYLRLSKERRKIYKMKKAAGKTTDSCLHCCAPNDSCFDCFDCEYNEICTLCCTAYCKQLFELANNEDDELDDSDSDDEDFSQEDENSSNEEKDNDEEAEDFSDEKKDNDEEEDEEPEFEFDLD